MSSQRLQLTTEPTQNHRANDAETLTETTPPTEAVRTPTDRAPKTFSSRNTEQLQNLIDEWNAAFGGSNADADSR